MDFELTEEQRAFQKEVAAFAQEEILPVAREIDEKDLFPDDVISKAAKRGLMGVMVDQKHGGRGLDLISYLLGIEEISKCSPAVALTISVNNSLICSPLSRFGNEGQIERYLERLASGQWLGSFALTEPGAGTDAGSITTTARQEGSKYLLNGKKTFITNMGRSRLALVFAKTSPEKGARGISAFLLKLPAEGLVAEEMLEKMGMRGSRQMSFSMRDVEVPLEDMLGSEGEGFRIAMGTLDIGRLGIAAQSLGIAQAALEDATAHATKREQFGRPISEFQAVQFRLADMRAEIEAARCMTLRAAWRTQEGVGTPSDSAMAKLLASRTAVRSVGEALYVLGGRGYLKGCRVERLYRDAKITEIYEGTSDVQRMIISREMLSGR